MGYSVINEEKIKKSIKKKQETILKNSKKLLRDPVSMEVGWFKESGKYYETEDQTEVQEVAKTHEYGLGGQTEKAFVRLTVEAQRDKWRKIIIKQIMKINRAKRRKNIKDLKKYDVIGGLAIAGEEIKKDLMQTIEAIDLIDTRRLVNSILIKFRRNKRIIKTE